MIYNAAIPYSNTIFNFDILKNAGGDPQLLLRNRASKSISRILLGQPVLTDFQQEYKDKIEQKKIRLYVSNADLLIGKYFNMDLHPILSQWQPGIHLMATPPSHQSSLDSCWIYRQSGKNWSNSGGDYDENQKFSLSRSFRTIYEPLMFDITDFSGSNGNGFLLKYEDETQPIGDIWIYSANTHTPLFPVEVLCIDDYEYITKSTTYQVFNTDDWRHCIVNLENEYHLSDVIKFKLKMFPKYYSRDWSNSYYQELSEPNVIAQQYKSTYAIYDITEIHQMQLIPHDLLYTRICCDGQSNYFTIDMSQFVVGRKYKIELQIQNRIIPIQNSEFKIV